MRASTGARRVGAVALALALQGCASDNDLVLADAARDTDTALGARGLLVARAHDLRVAAVALCAAAPATGGWTQAHDGASIKAMKEAWKDAHRAYDGLESATETFFPDLGADLDNHYEDAFAVGPDPDLLNGQGFIGLHAIERVLWADRIPASLVKREAALGYTPAAFPADASEAARFRTGLCARFVDDAAILENKLGVMSPDSSAAYGAALQLLTGQVDKLVAAGEGREESRYAGYTLADLSASLASVKATHEVFRPWLLTRTEGARVDAEIAAGFGRLEKEYDAFGSDALPYVPTGWSTADLTHDALETPFGQLFVVVSNEANASLAGSLAHSMDEAAGLLGIASE
jgi:iron uptake system component EfeO